MSLSDYPERLIKLAEREDMQADAQMIREAAERLRAYEDWEHDVTGRLQRLVHRMEWAPEPIERDKGEG